LRFPHEWRHDITSAHDSDRPLDEIVKVLQAVRDYRSAISPIVGVHVEGHLFSKAKAGAQRAEFIQDPSPAAVQQLLEHADALKRVTIAPNCPEHLKRSKSSTRVGSA